MFRSWSLRPLPGAVDVVIVGAGIMGLATAYHLARDHGARRILVLDAGYLCGGASGRNGGGVRAQWSSEANVQLMRESLAMCKEFAHEHRINTWFRQGGYLFLARDEKRAAELSKSVELQRRLGLETRLIDAAEAQRIVPQLEPTGVLAASFNADDAVVFPWPFVWGFAEGARALGVDIHTFCRVHAVETSPLVAPYAAAKAAMLSLTRTSAIEGKPKGIRANAVLPGAVDTPMLWDNPNIKSGAEVIDKADVGKPEEVAAVIAFLASDEASFMTGACVNVDGGRLAKL